MIDSITWADLRQLAEIDDPATVTLLMPTFESGRDVRQNSIRFKNLVNQLHKELKQAGFGEDQIKSRLRDASALINDDPWWQHQGRGLAWFATATETHRYRLPVELSEQLVVGKHVYLRPLIQVPQENGPFFLLAVSQNQVRLFQGNRFDMEQLHPDDLPSDLRTALNIDEFVQSIQQHSTAPPGDAGDMTFHGQGGAGMEVQKRDEILPFFRRIDRAFCAHFGEQQLPLIFAGVDFLFPLYQEVSDYKWLLDRPVEGNPDHSKPAELQKRALAALQPSLERARDSALETYHDAIGRQEAGHDPSAIMAAARDGLVESLLLSNEEQCWGIRCDEGERLELVERETDGAVDLGNEAAVFTLRTGGRVLMCPREKMPEQHTMAAVFRAPIPA